MEIFEKFAFPVAAYIALFGLFVWLLKTWTKREKEWQKLLQQMQEVGQKNADAIRSILSLLEKFIEESRQTQARITELIIRHNAKRGGKEDV